MKEILKFIFSLEKQIINDIFGYIPEVKALCILERERYNNTIIEKLQKEILLRINYGKKLRKVIYKACPHNEYIRERWYDHDRTRTDFICSLCNSSLSSEKGRKEILFRYRD